MQYIFFSLVLILLQGTGGVDYLDTNEFTAGFNLTTVRPIDKPNILGTLTLPPLTQAGQKPLWRLAQWATKFPLQPGSFEKEDETTWIVSNEAKTIALSRKDDTWYIRLRCNGIVEYQGRLRKYGEPWTHLLVEKTFSDGIKVTENNLLFNLEFRIINCICDPSLKDSLDLTLHTAQISAFWNVKNKNPNSKDYNDFFWFGIPIFDARYSIPPEYINPDKGSDFTTNKLITVVDGNKFYNQATGDGNWKILSVHLNPLLDEALRKGNSRGFLINSDLEDFLLTSFNLGWEITGPYDAEIEMRNLSLIVEKIKKGD